MEARRLGNNDIHLTISPEELSKLESLTEKCVVFSSELETDHPHDSLNGTKVQLVYFPSIDEWGDDIDGRDVISHFDNPPIPIYIGNGGITRLQRGEYCGGAFFETKIEIKVKRYRPKQS